MTKKKIGIMIGAVVISFTVCCVIANFAYQDHMKVVAREKREKEAKEKKKEDDAKLAFYKLFTDEDCKTVKLEVSKEDLDDTRNLLAKITNKSLQKTYGVRLDNIVLFIEVRDEINTYMSDGILKSTTTDEEISKLGEQVNTLEEGFRPLLQGTLDVMNAQRQAIKELDVLANSFYIENVVRTDIDMQAFYRLQTSIEVLPQKDIADTYRVKIQEIQGRLDELEAAARAQAEAERQAAIAAQIAESERVARENAALAAANVRIDNIPFINQKNGVLNGCEGASLLMGLQHFGIAGNLSLHDIAEAMPKHENDPHQGFIYDIFTSYPTNVPHWIAPDALAAFGQQYSMGVQDISGAGTDQLKAEIDAGNPVIIYATYGFNNHTGWTGEVPNNLHVMLLVGYNSINGNYVVIDPWGGIEQNISAGSFEAQYNTMHKVVVIRVV